MANLYNINKDLSNLIDEIEENGGEVTPEQSELLSIKREELEEKVLSYDSVLKFIASQEKAAEAEIERLKKFLDQKASTAEKLKANLLEALLLFGQEQKNGVKVLEFGTVKLSTRKSSSIEVEDSGLLPEKFKSYDFSISSLEKEKLDELQNLMEKEAIEFKTVLKADKKLIKAAIEAGEEVPGAKQNNNTNLKIS